MQNTTITQCNLVGLMGAGKSTLGRHLAKRLGFYFLDTDEEIERRTGVKIPTIFEIEGEAGFREREHLILDEIAAKSGSVVSTGGGIVLDKRNRALLHGSGFVIYLHANPVVLYERTKRDTNRPLLQVDDPLRQLKLLYEQRDLLYREVADVVVESRGTSIQKMLNQLEESLMRCVN